MTVTLTVDPKGPMPITLPAEDYDTVCAAIGLKGLGVEMGRTRLAHDGRWALTVGADTYWMTRTDG